MTDLTFKTSTAAKSTDWRAMDPNTLPADLRKLYDAYKAAQAIASTAKKAFESEMREAVIAPPGTQLYFGYLYGKLSYAFLAEKPAKAKASVVSFASIARK